MNHREAIKSIIKGSKPHELQQRIEHFYKVIDQGPNPYVGFQAAMMLKTDEPAAKSEPNQHALGFEMALKELLATQMREGLTVTEAVGTLDLCKMDIADQFFNEQRETRKIR